MFDRLIQRIYLERRGLNVQQGTFLVLILTVFLTGRDFSHDETLDVPTQVELLIKQATSHENLCQCYIGWSVQLFLPVAEFIHT